MTISASQVMELRSATGAGLMDCKKALSESGGDMDTAKDYLRKKGISIAAKKSDRETNEGAVGITMSEDGRVGAVVQLACETDFVARNEEFTALMDKLGAQVLAEGDTDVAAQKSRDGEGTVADVITNAIGKLGENMQLVSAARMELSGDGGMAGYLHSNKKIGALVMVQSDKAVAGEGVTSLARDIAMHVAASDVKAISEDEIDQAVLEKEREIFKAQAKESGKPDEIVEKMVQGRISKYIKEITLLNQSFVKNPDQTIAQLLADTGKELGATLSVARFIKQSF